MRISDWSSDVCSSDLPNDITFLRNIESPEFGGDTLWVNLEALYDSLSPSLKTLIDGLQAVHGRDDAGRGFPPEPRYDGRSTGPFLSKHPPVRVHPETGRQALFLSPGFIKYTVGLTDGESRALINSLADKISARKDP